jgi:hypothetical protein
MTHAGPQCPDLQSGSIYLTELAMGLEHLDFNKNGELKEGAWGILTLSGDSANFTFSSPKNFPFLKTVKRETYRSLPTEQLNL